MLGFGGGSPSPQPSPREERGEGEVITRRSCLNLNSSRFSAFSSEVETGSRQERASNQESRAPLRFHRSGKGSRELSINLKPPSRIRNCRRRNTSADARSAAESGERCRSGREYRKVCRRGRTETPRRLHPRSPRRT